MKLDHGRASAALHSFFHRNPRRLTFACACTALVAAVAWVPFGASASAHRHAEATVSTAKPLTKRQIIALIKKFAVTGPAGPQGPQGPQGPAGQNGTNATGGPPSGPAGGDLSGSYPNPSVAVGAITDSKVAAANKDGTASTPSLRTLGSGALQAMPGNATPGGPPTGAAGGALAGTYPNPTLNVSGGDSGATACKNGEALAALSTGSALSCKPGVYSDTNFNVTAGPNPPGALTTGIGNVALGVAPLHDTSGSSNTAIGGNALVFNQTGSNNTATGTDALFNTSASGNTAIGVNALTSDIGGGSNVAVGFDAGQNLTTGANNIDIGNSGAAAEANAIKIGTQGTQTSALLAGVDGETSTSGVPVLINGSGVLGTTTSSRRYKRDIRSLGPDAGRLMALRPVSFHYKVGLAHGQANPLQFGLVAEQVAKVYPNLVAYGKDGRPYEVRYQELPALLLAELQRQHARIGRQQAEIRWLRMHVQLKR